MLARVIRFGYVERSLPMSLDARRRGRFWILILLTLPGSAFGQEAAESHVVRRGDTLSEIAEHYQVPVDDLCARNGLKRHGVLRIGKRLLIPTRPSPRAAKTAPQAPRRTKRDTTTATKDTSGAVPTAKEPQSTGGPAAAAPKENDPEGPDSRTATTSWGRYSKKPVRPGYLRLESTVGKWEGQALLGHWEVPESARKGIADVLASWRTGAEERVHGRLIRLLVRVSNEFGGRPLRIVSGFRPRTRGQFTKHSKHNIGRAVDFSIPGVPNEALRDFLLATFDDVGVGYYPNSTHVHLDIRVGKTYWVDVSRPGEAPRYLVERRGSLPELRPLGPERAPAGQRETHKGSPEKVSPTTLAGSDATPRDARARTEKTEP